jgi:hypothetical protein
MKSWPNRDQLIENLFEIEEDEGITMTVLDNGHTVVDRHVLKSAKVFETEDQGEDLLSYYITLVNPQMDVKNVAKKVYDDQQEALMHLVELHSFSAKLASQTSSTGGSSTREKKKDKSAWFEVDGATVVSQAQETADEMTKTIKQLKAVGVALVKQQLSAAALQGLDVDSPKTVDSRDSEEVEA